MLLSLFFFLSRRMFQFVKNACLLGVCVCVYIPLLPPPPPLLRPSVLKALKLLHTSTNKCCVCVCPLLCEHTHTTHIRTLRQDIQLAYSLLHLTHTERQTPFACRTATCVHYIIKEAV